MKKKIILVLLGLCVNTVYAERTNNLPNTETNKQVIYPDEIQQAEDLIARLTVGVLEEIRQDIQAKYPNRKIAEPIREVQHSEPAPAFPDSISFRLAEKFNEYLRTYGTWLGIDDANTICWKPHEAKMQKQWHPYQKGQWFWTDVGWYWASDHPWGWAAYHYGRWELNTKYGWIWHPDSEWSPAWITWRANRKLCGWAPLPINTTLNAKENNALTRIKDEQLALALKGFLIRCYQEK